MADPENNEVEQPPGPSDPFTFDSPCPSPEYRVAVFGKAHFGAFTEGGEGDGGRLESVYGPPSSSSPGETFCRKHWNALDLGVDPVTYGLIERDPCDVGIFASALLTDPRWRTRSGIGRDSRAQAAARKRLRRCSRRSCGTRRGYVLADHRID